MAKIFIGNLPDNSSEREIEDLFQKFGKIISVSLKTPPRPPSFAFIEFEDSRDADDAVRDMHGRDFHGSRLRVEMCKGGPRDRRENYRDRDDRSSFRNRGSQYRVVLSNLATSVSWQDLKDYLRGGGDVVHADVDRRGIGSASFATLDDMERAIRKLDDTELQGERISIREDSSSGRRSRSRSPPRRRRSPSRSRSRSRSPPRRRRSRSYSR